MDDRGLTAAALAVAKVAPDMPLSLVRLREWWGCRPDVARMKSGWFQPCDWYGLNSTAGHVATVARRMKEASQNWKAHHGRDIVRHFKEEGFLDVEAAAMAMQSEVQAARNEGRDAALAPDLAELIAKHMAGELPARRGRRLKISGAWPNCWLVVNAVRREFQDRRASGEKYDALIAEFTDTLEVSRATVENWVSPKK